MRQAALLLVLLAGCRPASAPVADNSIAVTIAGPAGPHVFHAELADTVERQARGLMFRTDLRSDDALLFWPYPAAGGGPKVATFWMKDTPTPLDIVFIRADGTIARIAANATPMSETMISSNEPVAAVLELVGGRAAATGVSEGDRVSWPRR